MFGKLMNNFYYGKSGKGDYRKEDLPKNRWQLFWEMLRIRFSALIRLNLMYVVVWLPAMAVLMIAALSALTLLSEAATTEEMMQSLSQNMGSIVMSTLLLLVPCIAITGPCTAGVCYVTRNWARDEHAFIWSDFKDAVKENWKQGLAISVITGLLPLVVYVCWNFYSAMAAENPVMVVPQVLIAMVGFIWALAVTYFYPLMVSYKLKMREIAAQWPAAGGGAAALQLCGAPPACGAHGDCADLRLFLQPCMVGAGPVPVLFGIWLWSEPLCHRQLHQCGV